MVPRSLFLIAVLAVAGCKAPPALTPRNDARQPVETGYLAPPRIVNVTGAAAAIVLRGRASPGAEVRLATPAGDARAMNADARGGFTFTVPLAADVQVFGLSATSLGRRVQAEGYVAITPKGQVAMLRSGLAAERLDVTPGAFAIGAFDFDQAGAATLSGWSAPNAGLSVRLDGRQAAEARADEQGRYLVALPNLRPGPHRVEVADDGATRGVDVAISAPDPMTQGPIRASAAPGGTRIDWITPAGGVQSTLIVG